MRFDYYICSIYIKNFFWWYENIHNSKMQHAKEIMRLFFRNEISVGLISPYVIEFSPYTIEQWTFFRRL